MTLSRTQCENAARKLLIKQVIEGFALNVSALRFGDNKRVIFDTFENYAKVTGTSNVPQNALYDGCTLIKGDVYLILSHSPPPQNLHRSTPINSAQERLNWTLAHEVGHVILGHGSDGELQEREANLFASELLMPETVVLELAQRCLGGINARELSRLFGVSQSAARLKVEKLNKSAFYSAHLKKELLEKYRQAIDIYCAGRESGQVRFKQPRLGSADSYIDIVSPVKSKSGD